MKKERLQEILQEAKSKKSFVFTNEVDLNHPFVFKGCFKEGVWNTLYYNGLRWVSFKNETDVLELLQRQSEESLVFFYDGEEQKQHMGYTVRKPKIGECVV